MFAPSSTTTRWTWPGTPRPRPTWPATKSSGKPARAGLGGSSTRPAWSLAPGTATLRPSTARSTTNASRPSTLLWRTEGIMNRIRVLRRAAVPAAGVALLALIALLRPSGAPSAPKARIPEPFRATPEKTAYVRAQPVRSERPAPASVIAGAAEDERVRTTYKSYRTAVATGNQPLQKALLPVLARDRSLAVRYAEEDLRRSPSEEDRDITHRA